MGGTTIFGVSKTTINGWLAAIIGACGPLAVWLATQSSPKAATAAGIVTLVATVCRVWVGIIQGDTPAPGPNLSSKIPLVLLAALILPLSLTGCPQGWEQQAQAALAGSKATIDGAQAAYEASAKQPCSAVTAPCIPHTPPAYLAINQAKAGQTAAVDAMETYEQLKATNAASAALQKAQSDAAQALAAIPKLIADVKAFYPAP